LTPIEEALGHRFANAALLEQALTHRSWAHENGGPDNERLEFLGDAVLQLAASQLLLARYPDEREGPLTALRQNIVSERALAEVGKRLGASTALRLGKGPAQTGVADRDSVIANTVEALLGAVFLDAGLEAASAIVHRWFGDTLAALDTRAAAGGTGAWKHPWNRLQELTQSRWRVGPTWREIAREGDPSAQIFTVAVSLGQRTVATGQGRTQAEARTRAAERALSLVEGVEDPDALDDLPAGPTDEALGLPEDGA
jgi:ribonuclease-3